MIFIKDILNTNSDIRSGQGFIVWKDVENVWVIPVKIHAFLSGSALH
jgi:hypothetical protein